MSAAAPRSGRVLALVCPLAAVHPAFAADAATAPSALPWILLALIAGLVIGYALHMLVTRLFPDQSLLSAALAASRQRARTPLEFVEQATDAALVLDTDGRIVATNINLIALMALDTTDVIGKSAADTLPASLVDGMMIGFDTGLDSSGTFECINAAGERLTVEARFHAIGGPNGPVMAMTIHDLTESKRREFELATLAFTDQLTGLQNRLALTRRMSRLADDLSEGPEASFALFMMDLNKFKPINDTYGHAVGDKLLVEIGRRIRTAVPRNATVARLGGDEFVVVAGPRVNREAATVIANAIIAAVAQPVALEIATVEVGVSIGIAIAPTDATDPDVLMMAADRAMYQAKRTKSGFAFMQDFLSERPAERVA